MKLKRLIFVLLILALTACSQTQWIVHPGQEVTIYGHTCLTGAGATVILTDEQARNGYTVENVGFVNMTVYACD